MSPEQSHQSEDGDIPSDAPRVPEGCIALPEGGYVHQEAYDAYRGWERMATEANAGRSVFKKVFLLDRKTAFDFAREEALREDAERVKEAMERERDEGDAHQLAITMISVFERVLQSAPDGPLLREALQSHRFDSIISEDVGGRLPAEALQRALNAWYRSRGQEEIPLLSMPIGRGSSERDAEAVMTALIEEGSIGESALYVTEYISAGKTIRRVAEGMGRALQSARLQQKRVPTLFAFVMLGGYFPWVTPARLRQRLGEIDAAEANPKSIDQLMQRLGLDRAKADSLRDAQRKLNDHSRERLREMQPPIPIELAAEGKDPDEMGDALRKFAGLSRPSGSLRAKRYQLMPHHEVLRERVLQRVSERLLELLQSYEGGGAVTRSRAA